MRSDLMKKGLEKAPHRSLFKAMGLTDEEIRRPMVGIANSANEIIPGHIHLDKIAEAVKAGVRLAGGTPIEFCTIGVCDGIAMNHEGMKYSLASRELIADSVEIMAIAHPFDALVLIPNCDKIIPGMLMAAMRVNIPAIVISGGPMLAGKFEEKASGSDRGFRGRGPRGPRRVDGSPIEGAGGMRLPRMRLLCGYVHGQLHELSVRSSGDGFARERNDPGSDGGPPAAGQDGRDENHGSSGRRTSARETSPPCPLSRTPWRWIWRSAAPPTPCCTFRRSPMRPELNWT